MSLCHQVSFYQLLVIQWGENGSLNQQLMQINGEFSLVSGLESIELLELS